MSRLRLVLALAFFVPVGAALGALGTLDSGGNPWAGGFGGVLGTFCGLAFGGSPKWKVWDYVYGARNDAEGSDRET